MILQRVNTFGNISRNSSYSRDDVSLPRPILKQPDNFKSTGYHGMDKYFDIVVLSEDNTLDMEEVEETPIYELLPKLLENLG